MNKRRFGIALFVFGFATDILAQRPFAHHLQANFSQVVQLAQDSAGFLWVRGLSLGRFDGHNLITYSDSLGNAIHGFVATGAPGDVWVYNPEGKLLEYNRAHDRFISHGITGIHSMEFSKDGKLVLGQWEKGMIIYDPKSKSQSIHSINEGSLQDKIVFNRILALYDTGDRILIGTPRGLWLFDKQSKQFERPRQQAGNERLLTGQLRKIFPDPAGYWFYFARALVKVSNDFKVIKEFNFPEDVDMSNFLNNVDRDGNGIFWIGTNVKGLLAYNPTDNSTSWYRHNPDNQLSLASDIIQCVLADREQNIWVGTYDQGFDQLKKVSPVFYNAWLPGKATAGGPQVVYTPKGKFLLQESRTNGLWIAPLTENLTDIQFSPFKTASLPEGVHTINSRVGKNYWWVGTWQNGLLGFPIQSQTGLPGTHAAHHIKFIPNNKNSVDDRSVGVWLEHEGFVWFTAPQTTLYKFDLSKKYGTENSLKKYVHHSKDSTTISAGRIFGVVPAENGAYWVLTESGLDKLRNEKFEHVYRANTGTQMPWCITVGRDKSIYIGSADGLVIGTPDGGEYKFSSMGFLKRVVINFIHEDKLGRIWVGSTTGVYCYQPKENTVFHFAVEDGLPGPDFGVNASTETDDGLFIFGGYAQTIFNPLSFNPNTFQVKPELVSLKVNNKLVVYGVQDSTLFSTPENISIAKMLELDYKHNVFTLEFSSMELSSPNKNRYRYKLEGFDSEWIETDWKDRTATFTNLDDGEYTFRLQASNTDGVWGDNERALKVIILPPPWRTWWAYGGYSLMVIGVIVWARNNLVQRERLKSNLALAKVEQEKEHFELEKAKEVDKVKTSFFTNISHEFRTPLTLIKGPVQNLLEKYANDPKAQEQLKLVQRNSDLLLKLINQLLDLARLEAGSLKVEKSEGDVFSFVRAIASSFESFARQKNVSVQVNVPNEICNAFFDKDKVETILINLINNAIKFTPAGGDVTVIAEAHNEQPTTNNHQLTFRVKDSGIGIPSSHQQKIFERFHQVSEAHKEVGTGIGLALVKELVALMGGEILVTSEVGKGSEFKVKLPIEVSSRQATLSGQTTTVEMIEIENGSPNDEFRITNNEVDSTKPSVLVVEDNTDLRHFIIESLGTEFNFLEAENGKIGLETAKTEIPDLIISDVMMPEIDGITMAGKIKTDIRTSHIPLILLTAKSSEDSKLSGLSSGADDYLTKPFNKNELLLKVRNGVSRQLKLRERLRAELMSSAPKIEVLSEDEKFLNSVKEKILERLSDEQLSVESLADDIGMSRVQLYRKVSGLTGISVNELIRKLRLQRAAQLLQQNWGPVSQVAYEVGFSNLSYFSKVFKEEFGMLPSEYSTK